VCLSGARWLHDQYLATHRGAHLKVYAVWIHYYVWDSPSDIDSGILADSHVTQFWDPGQVTGHWFGDHVNGGGLAWDVYFLYGRSGRDLASPLSSGSPVIANSNQLSAALQQAE
jgi:hypothetical protein